MALMIETARRHAKPNRRPASGSSRLRGSGLGSPTSGAGPPPWFPVTRRVGNPGRSFLLPPAHRAPPKSRTDDDEPDRLAAIGHPERRPARDDPRDGLPRPGTARGRGAGGRHRNTRHGGRTLPGSLVSRFRLRPAPTGAGPAPIVLVGGPGMADRGTHRSRPRHEIGPRIGPPLPSGASRVSGPERAAAARGFSRNRARFRARRFTIRGANGTSRRDFAPGLRAGTSRRRGRSPPNSAGSTPQRA